MSKSSVFHKEEKSRQETIDISIRLLVKSETHIVVNGNKTTTTQNYYYMHCEPHATAVPVNLSSR